MSWGVAAGFATRNEEVVRLGVSLIAIQHERSHSAGPGSATFSTRSQAQEEQRRREQTKASNRDSICRTI